MKILFNKKDKEQAIMLAESEEDIKILNFLYPITFGFYSKWEQGEEEASEIKSILKRFPEVVGVGKFNSPEGYVKPKQEEPEYELKL